MNSRLAAPEADESVPVEVSPRVDVNRSRRREMKTSQLVWATAMNRRFRPGSGSACRRRDPMSASETSRVSVRSLLSGKELTHFLGFFVPKYPICDSKGAQQTVILRFWAPAT
ncbi:hypothetical protein NB063_10560 [Rhodopirellula sp. ICT_H3.1]|uniref:Uncharacterized protein n=1 Tax=Aporhodopirellula aestuarii TaxID=2950107 RepID=A0ABT0U395_9BACT|nr:hypothetical protein [Aporhodopirellula aestuarii]